MYKVTVVDDDYPVLELLSEAINWEGLELKLHGLHEDGLSALEHSLEDMPDILITDIGMPRMDGLELIARLKEQKPDLRVAILSCHSEFHYARKAMKMQVHDYLLKDTLDPADLQKLLEQFKESLDRECEIRMEESRLRHLADQGKSVLKETFFRTHLYRPVFQPNRWVEEAKAYGLDLEGNACLPVIGFVDDYPEARRRYREEDVLRFALNNVLEEAVRADGLSAVHFACGDRVSFLLFAYRPSLKMNIYDIVAESLKRIGQTLKKTLKLSMSFILGSSCRDPEQLKTRLAELNGSSCQRFYLAGGEIAKRCEFPDSQHDLFALYDEALGDFRQMLLDKTPGDPESVVSRWMARIRENRYPPETVKDWVLKLLLDLKLKFQSLQNFRTSYSAETLHQEIAGIDSLHQLERWLIRHFRAALPVVSEILGQSRNPEVLNAAKYVADHLHKKITLDEVARHLFLNPSYFSRLFRRETGETFIEYVTRSKMERAKELLDQTGHPVGKISDMLGYDNPSYFIKMFKTYTGRTPAEYRGKAD